MITVIIYLYIYIVKIFYKQLSDKKEKAAKTVKPKKVDTKNLGEAI